MHLTIRKRMRNSFPRLLSFCLVFAHLARCSVVECNADFDAKAARLLQWAKENGAKLDGITIRKGEHGAGLYVDRTVKRGERLVRIPAKLFLPCRDLEKEFAGISSLFRNFGRAVCLLQHKADPHSFWKPWIDTLPDRVPLLVLASADELSLLQNTEIAEWMRDLRTDVINFHRQHIAPNPDRFEPHNFSLDELVWAVSIMKSRSWESGLVPVVDFGNHHPDKGKLAHFDYSGSTEEKMSAVSEEPTSADLFAGEDLELGSELFMSYGEVGDAYNFLVSYGFVPNVHDDILFFNLRSTHSLASSNSPRVKTVRSRLMKQSGSALSASLMDSLPSALLDHFRWAALDEGDLHIVSSFSPVRGEITTANEERALSLLHQYLDNEFKELQQTSIEEDEFLMEAMMRNSTGIANFDISYMMVRARLNQKLILRATKRALARRQSSLAAASRWKWLYASPLQFITGALFGTSFTGF